MNPCVNQPINSRRSVAEPAAANRVLDDHALDTKSHEVRLRLLRMIKDNEQKRHSDVSSPSIQR